MLMMSVRVSLANFFYVYLMSHFFNGVFYWNVNVKVVYTDLPKSDSSIYYSDTVFPYIYHQTKNKQWILEEETALEHE